MHSADIQRRFWKMFEAIFAVSLIWSALPARGQEVVQLLRYTDEWRYDQTGRDLGTEWRTNSFDDSAWLSGSGLFGREVSLPFPYPVPILTPLDLVPPGGGAGTITYYFRRRFQFSNPPVNVVLYATNLVDDGCVIYLNGVEAGRLRVPTNQTFATQASSDVVEGTAENMTLDTTSLRSGENVLAAEVHQGVNKSDVAWGMSLVGHSPLPLIITNQPASQTNLQGTPSTLVVGVSGGPAFFQWRKDGTNIAGANSASYAIANSTVTHSGTYTVLVTNAISSVLSRPATLLVVPDTIGPRLVSARVSEIGATNTIRVIVNERLLASTASSFSNYALTLVGSTNPISFQFVSYNRGPPSQITLTVPPTNWVIGGNYYLTVNHVRDNSPRQNVIAPDTRIAVAWPRTTNLLNADALWRFHAAYTFEPTVFNDPWMTPDYAESLWAEGRGPFCGGPANPSVCLGSFQTEIGYQPQPSLFRTTFDCPPEFAPSASLRFVHVVDDGAAFYLNGAELFRANLPGFPTPLAVSTSATFIAGSICGTNIITVSNLVPGINHLAAAVFQAAGAPDSDSVFALQLDATSYFSGPLPPEDPAPLLTLVPASTNAFILSWTGAGYALEAATNFSANSASAPFGPWTEVPNMSNPYLDTLAGPQRFYRLRK